MNPGLLAGLLAVVIPLAAYGLGKLARLRKYARLAQQTTVYSQYEAPALLTPAECGYVIDGSVGNKEVMGTLFHMTYRKLLSFDARAKSFALSQDVYPEALMNEFEYPVVSYIKENGPLTLQTVRSGDFVATNNQFMHLFKADIRKSLSQKDLLATQQLRDLLWTFRGGKAFFIIVYAALASGVLVWANTTWQPNNDFDALEQWILKFGLLAIMLPIAGLATLYVNLCLFLHNRGKGLPWAASALLSQNWDELVGYKLYLRVAEADRTSVATDVHDPNHAYVIALGLAKY